MGGPLMTSRLLITGKNSQIQSDAFQALGSACGFGAAFLPVRPSVPCADFYSGGVAGFGGPTVSGIEAPPGAGSAARRSPTMGGATKRGSGRKHHHTSPIHPERPDPTSVTAGRAASLEVLMWLALLLIVLGIGKGGK